MRGTTYSCKDRFPNKVPFTSIEVKTWTYIWGVTIQPTTQPVPKINYGGSHSHVLFLTRGRDVLTGCFVHGVVLGPTTDLDPRIPWPQPGSLSCFNFLLVGT